MGITSDAHWNFDLLKKFYILTVIIYLIPFATLYLSLCYSPAVELNLFSLNFHPILGDVSVTSLSFG